MAIRHSRQPKRYKYYASAPQCGDTVHCLSCYRYQTATVSLIAILQLVTIRFNKQVYGGNLINIITFLKSILRHWKETCVNWRDRPAGSLYLRCYVTHKPWANVTMKTGELQIEGNMQNSCFKVSRSD